MRKAIAAAGIGSLLALAGCDSGPSPVEDVTTIDVETEEVEMVAPVQAEDHAALLASEDPQLAANKQLVYDMYRIVLQAGLADRAHEFIAEDYIQHNPNADQGLDGLIAYVKSTRPEREIKDKLDLPLVHLMAEGNYVSTTFVRPEKDANGETYYSSWFDLYRIEDGKIAEHWDPMLKTDEKIDPNEKKVEG
jgi:predicted SnoaL-like aldol condensation-catalyzing enzyme